MAGNLSNYLEDKIVDHFLGTSSYTSPTNVYVALYTVGPTDSGGGTEVTGGSYVRKLATFGASSSGSASNNINIDFPNMPACTVVAIGIHDSSTSGNLLAHGTLDINKSLDSGDTFRLQSGDLTISID